MDWRSRMRAQPCELGEMPPPAPNARSSDGQSRLDGTCSGDCECSDLVAYLLAGVSTSFRALYTLS